MIALPIEKLRTVLNCPSLAVHTHESWGSSNPEYRTLIREFITKNIPKNIETHHSISHCRESGLIVVANKNIGVDIEESARVKEAVIKRMSTEQEILAAPSFACLWAAKEASFKGLMNYKQPMVISRLEIGKWQQIDDQIETFRLTNNNEFHAPAGQGIVIKGKTHVISIFVFPA